MVKIKEKESIHKVGRANLVPYVMNKKNKISILKNILINNGTITAYYVLYPFNYEVYDFNSSEKHIDSVYNILSTLYRNLGEIKISMFKASDIVSKGEVIRRIEDTVGIYNKDNSFDDKYKPFIKPLYQEFSILAINIESNSNVDIETQGIIESIKQVFDTTVNNVFRKATDSVNIDSIMNQNKNYSNTLRDFAVPANEKLVTNIYMNSLFPAYDLIYTDEMLERTHHLLGSIKQDIIPHLGWFELSNSGIADFGCEPKISYCSILNIVELPETILNENFNIFIPGMKSNMKLLDKEKALNKFKRMRADLEEELGDAYDQNADDDSDSGEALTLTQRAINGIKHGRIVTDLDLNILIVADTKEELDRKKKNIISTLGQVHVIATIAANQAKSFIRSFIECNPDDYYHTTDLLYAISFQIDSGTSVGDYDSKYASPVIGIS